MSVENLITMHFLHQILLLSNDNSYTQLPIAISNNAAALKEVYPAAQYRLWNRATLETIIAENFSPEVLWAFKALRSCLHLKPAIRIP